MLCSFEGGFKCDIVISCIKVTKLLCFDFDHKCEAYLKASPIQITVMISPGLIVHDKKTQAIILGNCPLKNVFFTLVTLLFFKNNLYFEFHMIPNAILHKSQTLKNKIK